MSKTLNHSTASKPLRPVKIIQFGEGNFLRAFADWMVDIANEKTDFNGAIQIVQPIDRGMAHIVNEQDGLYHVVLNGMQEGKAVRQTRLITSIADAINPFDDYQAFLRTAENPELRFIISNTTEAGIIFNAKDNNPEQLAETFPGKLTALLYHRYKFFKGDSKKALIIMPCELIEKNGEALLNTIIQYIIHWKLEDDFRTWITSDTLFCNTLVDRIVPGFPKDIIEEIWKEVGYNDKLVVTAELFYLWVIEPLLAPGMSDQTLKNEFPLEQAGLQVKFVRDLTPYRSRKVRILNGAHTAMVPIGMLQGLQTVREVIDDPSTGNFIRKAVEEEIIPTLDLPREELGKFANDVMERFRNPFIRHELKSIALNSISKYQVRVLPSVLEYFQRTGKLPDRLLYALAALICFYKGEWQGETIQLNDTPAVLAIFEKAWKNENLSSVVEEVLSNHDLWNMDLTRIDGLSRHVEKHLVDILKLEKVSGR